MQCFYDTKKKTSGDHLLFAKKQQVVSGHQKFFYSLEFYNGGKKTRGLSLFLKEVLY